MTYEDILSRFKVKQNGNGKAKCVCPAHNDKEASLVISKGEDGKTVMRCFAGCEVTDILEKVNLKMSDLFEEDQKPSGEKWRAYIESREGKKIEGVYPYYHEGGQYAFTKLRLSGKKFVYGRMEGERFLYGLPDKKKRSELPFAVYCDSVGRLRRAVKEGKPIFYCEGEKDVNTVKSRGLTAFTCGSTGDWDKRCATLCEGAEVVILGDNDDPGRKLAKSVKRDLLGVAKSVRIVIPTPTIEHGDVSDFFKDHTIEDFEKLLKEEPSVEEEEAEAEELDLDQFHLLNEKGNPTGVFDFAILQYLKKTTDLFVLGGVPFVYRDGVFRADRSGAELKTMIRDLIYPKFVKSTTVKRVYELFISDAELQVSPEELNDYPSEWICFRNGFYDPVTKTMKAHDPKYRAVNQIPWEYDPEGEPKGEMVRKWLDFICEAPDDKEMLLQFSGLCLTRDTRQQKFLILCGEGGTGKSTVIRMIDKMIGSDNISNISLNQLTQRFFSYGLMGKLLNSCADLEVSALEDTSTLKKVLGEDTLSGEAKGKDSVSFKSYAKLIFSTNELPIVKSEKTNGFYRRLLILTMDKIPDRKEPNFFDKLSDEIEDFIRLSVKALERMYADGRIVESRSSVEAVKKLRCDSDTVEAFLDAMIVKDRDNKLRKPETFTKYVEYCDEMERQPLTKQNFFRSMRTKGFFEFKSHGLEYYRGINWSERFSKQSPQNSPGGKNDGWMSVEGYDLPFD